MKRILTFLILSAAVSAGFSQEATHWRGETMNGIYDESGLLKSWPVEGPEMLWVYEQLGQGHSSAVIDQGFIYTTGMTDGTGFLFKFDSSGKLLWKKGYGPEFTESWYGTRGSPVVAGKEIYIVSGNGVLYCLKAADGSKIWSLSFTDDLGASRPQWGYNETPVVDGDVIYATPGGNKHNVVALNRNTGALIWSGKARGERSAYCTPLLFTHNGRKLLATHTASHLVGLDALTGEMLWSQSQPNEWSVHANTPLYHDGAIFYFSGYGQGGGMLKLSPDGSSAKQAWFNKNLDSRMGGAVEVDGFIYSSGDYAREWRCVEWESGKERYASADLGKGVVIYADGMLYCYSDRGELALVKADPSGFKVISKTSVTHGSEQHWAHPVIYDGVLYLRHGNALMAYKVGN